MRLELILNHMPTERDIGSEDTVLCCGPILKARPRLRDFALPLAGLGIVLTIIASEYVTTPHPEPGPVHIAYWEKWTGFEGDAMQDVVNAFNRKQHKIHVDLLTVSNIKLRVLNIN